MIAIKYPLLCPNNAISFKYGIEVLVLMKVLVTGGSGLLGSAVAHHFKDYHDVTSTYTTHKVEIKGCNAVFMDITDSSSVSSMIRKIKPDVVVHTAALVGVGICEKDPELAEKVNVQGTKNVVEECKKSNSKLVYISTDYIFNGKKGNYTEEDEPSPINVYGKTKYEGELLINAQKDAIIRTSIYGWNIVKEKRSFSTWIIDDLRNKKQINIFMDNMNSMMLVNNLAEALKEFIDKDMSGIMNLASADKLSKYDFAIKLAEIFKLDKSLINPIRNDQAPGSDKRPLDVSLSISKAKKQLKTKLLNAEESLSKLKKLEQDEYLKNFKVM